MNFLEFIRHFDNNAFLVSIIIMLIMASVEMISMLLGVSISEAVDNLLPDVDIDVDLDGVDAGNAMPILDWLNFGRIPFIILIILFLTLFGLSGFFIQGVILRFFGALLPLLIAVIVTLAPAFIFVHYAGRILSRILPQVETTAVRLNSLIGTVAEINLGTASQGNPAEAKAKDRYGKVHYVRVEPVNDEEKFIKGDKVLLVFFENGIFKADKADISLI